MLEFKSKIVERRRYLLRLLADMDVKQSRCILALKHLLQLGQRGAHVGTPWLVRRRVGAGDEAEEEFGVRIAWNRKLLR